ncbi:MarR family winged helix-turn-helix transcriptional regulator [Vampirovibrio sp.]|uniref:MarR family winged helix-turn-helix transcriptional regulator n=1 Tax=Vampirovibrio sp. TaxID=2717857 RepID=UPI00359426C9
MSTPYNPEIEPYLSAHLWTVMRKATQAITAHDLKSIESSGLCFSDFATLEALLHKGAMPIHLIGEKVQLTSGSITTAIDRLEKRGLVQRQASATDRRIRLVNLTEAGQDLIERFFKKHVEALEQATRGLDQDEKTLLINLLKKLGKQANGLL